MSMNLSTRYSRSSYSCNSFKIKVYNFPDGYCPEGWIAHAQYCYEFHTNPAEYRSWDDARDSCELGLNSSSYGELASIHDE